jgi:hypothetical protein
MRLIRAQKEPAAPTLRRGGRGEGLAP